MRTWLAALVAALAIPVPLWVAAPATADPSTTDGLADPRRGLRLTPRVLPGGVGVGRYAIEQMFTSKVG